MIDFGLELDPLLCWDKSICISWCKNFVNFAKQTYFFYFTPQLFQNTHISLSIIHIYSNKIFIFTHQQRLIHTHHQPTQPPSSSIRISHHHQKPSSPCTIINHHHPKTHWSNKELKRSKPQNPLIKQSFRDDRWWHGESFSKWASEFALMSEIWRRSRQHGKSKGGTACFFGGLLWRSSVVACFGDRWLRVRDQR